MNKHEAPSHGFVTAGVQFSNMISSDWWKEESRGIERS